MGNERSGRGGISPEKFDRALRMSGGGFEAHEIARTCGIDRKTAQKICSGEHVFQLEGRFADCPICGRRVDELPCKICLATPLDLRADKRDPRTLGPVLFEREETAVAAFDDLVRSINQLGMTQPPLIAEDGSIILGGRRVRAAIDAGLPSIHVLVVHCNRHRQYDAMLTEEFLRVDRDPIERARMLRQALDDPLCAHTQKTLGERIGRSQSYVALHVNLLKLPEWWRELLIARAIDPGHARYLIKHADNPRLLMNVFRRIDENNVPGTREFRTIVDEEERRLRAAEEAKETESGDSPLDELLEPPTRPMRTPTREIKLRYTEPAADEIELRMSAIADATDCESNEEVLKLLIDEWWERNQPPREARAAALGLRVAA